MNTYIVIFRKELVIEIENGREIIKINETLC